MALGSMAVLGIGSNLSWDYINQMKDQEVKWRVDPITKKIEQNLEKQKELTSLTTMMTTLNSSFKKLSDFSTYQQRKTTVEGSGVKATAGEGLAIQDIKINVNQLAQNDVNQVGMQFASRDSIFTNKNTTIDFYHNGTSYSIDVKAGSTLAEVSQSITDATDGAVMGIIMKTGGDNPYRLMIQSKESGKDNKIYFGTTLQSAAMPGGHIKSGTLDIEIGGKKITLDMATDVQSKLGNTAEDNAKAVLEAINKKIENDSSLKDLKDKIDSGEITIGLNSTGKGLIFNDSKGGAINITTTDIKMQGAAGTSEIDTDLGFVNKSAGKKDLITGNKSIAGGQLNGTISINGEKIDLSTFSETLGKDNAEKIAEAINQNANLSGKVTASVKDGKLVLNSNDGNNIIISAEGNNDAEKAKVLEAIGLQAGTFASSQSFMQEMDITNIQKAQNAEFTYNGIKVERSKNEINDVVSGLSLELTAITEANKEVTVRVSRNDEGISEALEDFVKNYNEVYNKIQELVKYDETTKVAGVFNGNSEMRSIIRQLNSIINSNDVNGNNLLKFGISISMSTDENGKITSNGTLKFDKEKFEKVYKEDPEAAISFFRSTTSTVNGNTKEVDGVFTRLRNTMDGLITGDKATLNALEQSLKNEHNTLSKDKTSTQESIDTRYETLASKWSAYDQLIAKSQQQANVVQQMIQQSMNS
ncbi:flagellar filament capping protein FliD [Helicobacter sp. MIT 11-5569]|uniref:flagellar filament capping protein FliD n=1 Tax=Helicobacter sp. MIT 11-5569 TaxID=1548151 RepID=UPI00051FCE00|nr:flagellar filament capping protein FliD [Helicobacter sp. MIT 11-5569]TLD85310.1 flagellar filament capping protein FliD [Helicobacter sp. MIT 11-5569]